MQNPLMPRWTVPALALAVGCSAMGWGVYAAQPDPVAAKDIAPAVAMAPAKPQLSAERAWSMLDPQIESSPWLSKADETARWIDQAGEDAQLATGAVSGNLRELSVLMNEHWAGRMSAEALKAIAGGTAAIAPDPTTRTVALGVVYAIDHADEWALALADQTDELGEWVEAFTEPYERYAQAYAALNESPTADHFQAWVDASQALLPYLEQAERVCTELDKQLASVHSRLESVHESLAGADHWSVDWIVSQVDSAVICPCIEQLASYQADVKLIQGRVAFDHGLIASLPDRFARYEIVD